MDSFSEESGGYEAETSLTEETENYNEFPTAFEYTFDDYSDDEEEQIPEEPKDKTLQTLEELRLENQKLQDELKNSIKRQDDYGSQLGALRKSQEALLEKLNTQPVYTNSNDYNSYNEDLYSYDVDEGGAQPMAEYNAEDIKKTAEQVYNEQQQARVQQEQAFYTTIKEIENDFITNHGDLAEYGDLVRDNVVAAINNAASINGRITPEETRKYYELAVNNIRAIQAKTGKSRPNQKPPQFAPRQTNPNNFSNTAYPVKSNYFSEENQAKILAKSAKEKEDYFRSRKYGGRTV